MSNIRNLKINGAELVSINEKNLGIYINLAHAYEAEFSGITKKKPDEFGIFQPDTMPIPPYSGFLLYNDKTPVGFCVAEISNDINDIAEFYIIPSMRKNKFGYTLATTIFEMYPGKWQVRQIDGADSAKAFWRKVIGQYTKNSYVEAVAHDPDWGVVTRQQFISVASVDPNQISKLRVDGLPENSVFKNPNSKPDASPVSTKKSITPAN